MKSLKPFPSVQARRNVRNAAAEIILAVGGDIDPLDLYEELTWFTRIPRGRLARFWGKESLAIAEQIRFFQQDKGES